MIRRSPRNPCPDLRAVANSCCTRSRSSGMDQRDEILESAGELAGLHAVDLAELVRPGGRVAFNVAHPASELGEPLRLGEVVLLLIQFDLDPLAMLDLLLQRAIAGGERRRARIDPLVEPSCVRRSSSSVRLRTATSALSARLGTATLIMNISSSRNESFRVAGPNGPPPASVAQTAKQDRMSATVAVSRWPRRSADHTSGRTARKPSGARCALCSTSGLNAITPMAQVPAKSTSESNKLLAPERRPAPCRPEHDDGRDDQRAREIAEPPGEPDRAELRPFGEAASARLPTPIVAHERRRNEADQRKPRHSDRAWQSCRGRCDQRLTSQPRSRLRAYCRRRWRARSQANRRW